MALHNDHSVSFIVRVWCESSAGAGGPWVWRGSIEEVETRERIYYTDAQAMMSFIGKHMEAVEENATRRSSR